MVLNMVNTKELRETPLSALEKTEILHIYPH